MCAVVMHDIGTNRSVRDGLETDVCFKAETGPVIFAVNWPDSTGLQELHQVFPLAWRGKVSVVSNQVMWLACQM